MNHHSSSDRQLLLTLLAEATREALNLPCRKDPNDSYAWLEASTPEETMRAIAACQECPAKTACKAAGREGNEFGVWGGESTAQRRIAARLTRQTDDVISLIN